jgi:hypothetical protein
VIKVYRYGVYPPKSYRPYGSSTYADMSGPEGYLAETETFAGQSMHGEWTRKGGDDLYVVYSYGTAIAIYDPQTNERFVSVAEYSATTTFHRELCRAWLPGHNPIRVLGSQTDAKDTRLASALLRM